jgi:hypothetical protein
MGLPPRGIEYAVLEKSLGVWKAARAEGTIRLEILMYGCDFIPLPV